LKWALARGFLWEDQASGESLLQDAETGSRFPVLCDQGDSDNLMCAHAFPGDSRAGNDFDIQCTII
jgi:hypothetical protein